MKKIVIAAVVVAAILLLGPLATGFYIKNAQEEFVAELQENNPLIDIEQVSYNRGWFSSDSIYEVRSTFDIPSADETPAEPLALRFSSKNHHGPLPLSALSDNNASFRPAMAVIEYRFALNELLAKTDKLETEITDPRITGYSRFLGGFKYQCDMPEGSITAKLPDAAKALAEGESPAFSATWKAIECAGISRKTTTDGTALWPEVVMQLGDEMTMTMSNVRSDTRVVDKDTKLPLASGTVDIESMVMAMPPIPADEGEPPLDMSSTSLGIHYEFDSSRNGNKIDFDMLYTIDKTESALASATDSRSRYLITGADRDSLIRLQEFGIGLIESLINNSADPKAALEASFADGKLWERLTDLAKIFNDTEISFEAAEYNLDYGKGLNMALPNIEMKQLAGKFHIDELLSGIPLGGYTLGFDTLNVDLAAVAESVDELPVKLVALKGFNIKEQSTTDGDTLAGSANISLDGIQLDDDTPLKDIELDITLDGLSKPVVEELAVVFRDSMKAVIEEKTSGTPSSGEPPESFRKLTEDPEKLMKMASQLVQNAKLAINTLQASTSNGSLKAGGALGFNGSDLAQLSQLMDLVAAIAAGFNLSIDKALINDLLDLMWKIQSAQMPEDMPAEQAAEIRQMMQGQITGTLNQLVAQGFFVETPDSYSAKADFNQATLQLNGNEIPLPLP